MRVRLTSDADLSDLCHSDGSAIAAQLRFRFGSVSTCRKSGSQTMQFAWDPGKAQSNLSKHHVSFALAERVFDDPLHIVAFRPGRRR